MPEKRKTPVTKTVERRMTDPPAHYGGRLRGYRARHARAGPRAAQKPLDAHRQLEAFEAGMKLFHARNLGEARELFHVAARGPERDVAHRAKLHASMCDRRLDQPAVTLSSAEDYYNYGVALLNARTLPAARQHLEAGAPPGRRGADHIQYALAVALALSGELGGRIREPPARHRTGAAEPDCGAPGPGPGLRRRPASLRRAAVSRKEKSGNNLF